MDEASFETQGQDLAAAPADPMPAAAPAPAAGAARPAPLELVTEPGRIKHIRFEADPRPAPAAPAVPERPAPSRGPIPDSPPLAYRSEGSSSRSFEFGSTRRTLYRTDQGGEVIAYESRGRRELAVTERTRDGRFEERRFDSRLVDAIVKDVPMEASEEPEAAQEAPQRAQAAGSALEAKETKAERRFRLFGRSKPGEDSGTSYRPATVVEGQHIPAWEPSAVQESTHDLVAEQAPLAEADPPVASRTQRSTARGPYVDYKGDSHPIDEIEGIGPATAKRLHDLGIHTTARLCAEDPAALAASLDLGERTVRAWHSMAQLIKVKGIGRQSAEVLARVGVEGIDDLRARDPEQLAARLDKFLAAQASSPIGARISAKRIAGWQKAARKMRKAKQDRDAL